MKDDDAFALVGFADPSGMRLGFLVPVFRSAHANAPMIQRFGRDSEIAAFESYEALEPQLLLAPSRTKRKGDTGIHAFATDVGEPLLIEDESGRNELAELIERQLLPKRPLLAIEAASFLKRQDLRDEAAKRVYQRFQEISLSMANNWRDLSVLTADVHREILMLFELSEARSLDGLVLRVDKEVVKLIGVPSMLRPSWKRELQKICQKVLEALPKLYPEPPEGWQYRFIRSEASNHEMSADAALLITSLDRRELADSMAASPVLRLDISLDENSQIAEIFDNKKIPVFVIYDSRKPNQILRTSSDLRFRAMHAVALGLPGPFPRNELPKRPSPWRTTYISRPGFRAGSAKIGEHVAGLHLAIAAELDRQKAYIPSEVNASILLQAKGLGPQPITDAIAALYDRAWSLGLSPWNSLIMVKNGRQLPGPSGLDPDLAALALFKSPQYLHGQLLERTFGAFRTTAALLVDASPRESRDNERHSEAITEVLTKQRWEVSSAKRSSAQTDLVIHGARGSLKLRVGTPLRVRADNKAPSGMTIDLCSIKDIVVTCDATAKGVMIHLAESGELAINVRDLMRFDPGYDSVLSLFANQLTRLVTGLPSRSQSLFLAMLVNQAYRTGNVYHRDANFIERIALSPALGEEMYIVVSSRASLHGSVTATVSVVPARGGAQRLDLLKKFKITIDYKAVSVSEI
jgi:hypothetical protein